MDTNYSGQEPNIMELFSSSDPDDLRAAAYESSAARMVDAVPHLVRLIQSDNLGVQEAAEDALRSIRGSEAVKEVAPLLHSDDPSVRNSAMDILREIGEDDMKTLVSLLGGDDPDVRIFVADILGSSKNHSAVPLLSEVLLSDPEVNVRYQAAVSLGELGDPDAAPALREAMKDEEWVQFAVVEALAKIRAESCLDILIKALPESSPLVASTIIDAFGEMEDLKAVPCLLKELDDASGPLRNKSVKALVHILGTRSLTLLDPLEQGKIKAYLLAALDDEDDEIIDAALIGLSSMGSTEATRSVLSHGAKLDPDSQHDLLADAVKCLVSMGFNKALSDALHEPDERLVRLAAEACCNMPSNVAVDALIEAFWTFPCDVQAMAIQYLSKQASESHVSFFRDILSREDVDPCLLKEAMYFLGQRFQRRECGKAFLSFLTHPNDEVKDAALEAALGLGDPTVNASLVSLSQKDDPILRKIAVYSMGRIGAKAYCKDLALALEDAEPDIRKMALEALAEDQSTFLERLPMLAPRLGDESKEVRLAFIDALDNCQDNAATEMLFQALDDPDDWVRIRAIESLARRKEAAAVPHLVRMIGQSDTMVILKIIDALGAIGNNTSFRALLTVMGHNDPEVQQAAAEAIDRIREEHGEY